MHSTPLSYLGPAVLHVLAVVFPRGRHDLSVLHQSDLQTGAQAVVLFTTVLNVVDLITSFYFVINYYCDLRCLFFNFF